MSRVELDPQVAAFVRGLAPDARKRVRNALRGLTRGKGDIKALQGKLEGFSRLRVGPFRIILQYLAGAQGQVVRCIFAERRSLVYELFSEIVGPQN